MSEAQSNAAVIDQGDPSAVVPESLRPSLRLYGVSGTESNGGRISRRWDETFPSPEEWANTAEEMRLHPAVADAYETRKAHILSARWVVVPAIPDDPVSEAYAQHIRDNVGLDGAAGRLLRPFEAIVEEAADCHYFGFSVGEIRWQYSERKAWVVDIEGREQRSIDKWGPNDGSLGPIVQRVMTGPKPKPMAADKVILFNRKRTGQDWQGLGLARAAWHHWKSLRYVEDVTMAGIERAALMPPVITEDPERMAALFPYGDSSGKKAADELREAARQYSSGRTAAVFSEIKDALTIRFLANEGFDPTKNLAYEQHLKAHIYRAFGAEWALLGFNGNAGNKALGDTYEGFVRMFAINDVEAIAGPLNGRPRPGGGLIGRMIDNNFANADMRRLPLLWHEGLEPNKLAALLPFLAGLIGTVVTPTDSLENAILRSADLPELGPDERRTPDERSAGGSPVATLFSRVRAEAQQRARTILAQQVAA